MAFLLFLFLVCSGCASKEEQKAEHLQRAREYVAKSEFKKAAIEFKNVVQLDPKDDVAHYELGETYLKLKQGDEAFRSFSRAASINPENLKAQLKVGEIYLLGERVQEAKEKAELVLKASPDDIEALLLVSGIQVQEQDLEAAMSTLEKVVSIDPGHFQAHLSLARLFLAKGDLEEAEKAYLHTISLDPSALKPRIELSGIYANRGEWDKAETELKRMLEASTSKHEALGLLAFFYETRGNRDQAEKTYLAMVDSAPEGEVAPLMNLAGYYARQQSYEKALEAMEKAAAIQKDNLDVPVSMAQLHLDFQKTSEAEALVDAVLVKDKGHVGANLLKGRLDLARRDFGRALERFELVVRESPQNAMAHYFKALCLLGKGERELAQQDLLKSVELNPGMVDARFILAEFYLRDRDLELARQQIEIVMKQAPSNVRALMLQASLKSLEGDVKGAETVFQRVIELDPNYSPAYLRLGVLYSMNKENEAGLRSFEKALQLDPQGPQGMGALGFIVRMYVQEKKYDQAFGICEKHKQQAGDTAASSALIEHLQGSIFLAKEDTLKAQQHFEKAIEIEPNILAPYLALATIYRQENRLSEAISQYETILNRNPNYLAGYMALGTIYDQQGDGGKAEIYYRKALAIKSDFAPAANNLAWNLADRGKNIDEALGFAQTAKEHMPDSPSVMDTLGWIYYLKGSYLNAIAEFQDALQQQPDHPVINYHLGLAFYKNTEPEKATEFLQKALSIAQDFKGSEEARSILEEIQASAAPS